MKKCDFESFQRGMAEAEAYLKGAREGYVVHEPVDFRKAGTGTKSTGKILG